MANRIVTKYSATANAVPSAAALLTGEIGINLSASTTTQPRIFSKDGSGSIVALAPYPSLSTPKTPANTGSPGSVSSSGTGVATSTHVHPHSGIYCVEALLVPVVGQTTRTYTVTLDATSTLMNIAVTQYSYWTAASAGAVTLNIGDSTNPSGFFNAIDLKSTSSLASGGTIDFAKQGGFGGSYISGTYWTNLQNVLASRTINMIVSAPTGFTAGGTTYVRFDVFYPTMTRPTGTGA